MHEQENPGSLLVLRSSLCWFSAGLRGWPGMIHIGSFMWSSIGHKSGTRGSLCSLPPTHPRTHSTPSPRETAAQQSIRLIEDDSCSLIWAGRTFVAPHALDGTA